MTAKIIHWVWFDFGSGNGSIPPSKYDKNVASWKAQFPDYRFMTWNENDALDLLKKFNSRIVPQYQEMEPIVQTDFIRFVILYMHGGIYTDFDVVCLKNFESYLAECRENVCLSQGMTMISSLFSSKNAVNNMLMVSKIPRHPFWLECISQSLINSKSFMMLPRMLRVLRIAGPHMLTSLYKQFKHRIHVLPSDKFNPVNNCQKCTPHMLDVFTIHQYDHSWLNASEKRNKNGLYCYVDIWSLLTALVIIVFMYQRSKS